ncbi:MAG TPA: rhodanese-like domain-containing protein [Blastocatellia bacterium]|nr:rhodanese-like domain-containing protein [Blastocatellia bacterium]
MNRISSNVLYGVLGVALVAASACSTKSHATGASNSTPATNAVASSTATPAVLAPASGTPLPGAQAADANEPRVSGAEAKQMVDAKKAVLVDVRSIDAYKSGHAEGAIHIALHDLEEGKFKALPKDKTIITYCTCPTEGTSGAAVHVLQKAGYKNVTALKGGLEAWKNAGGAVTKAEGGK